MKKIMIMILAVVPLGIFAQSAQNVYAVNDDISSMSYAELGNTFTGEKVEGIDASISDSNDDYVSENEMLKVNDMLLFNPDFDIEEDMISYTKDQKTVYFSVNRKIKVKKGNQLDVTTKKSAQLQLFKANVTESGEWVNLEMLPFNGKSHSTGHPALNIDDTKLYFVSDGPESTGKTDIFVVDLLEDGTYGQPENLGSEINSEEREVFPFIDNSSVLYFASDIETSGDELNVFASEVVDNKPSAPIKLNVEATASKEDYIAAFNLIETEALLAEKKANLIDLEILLEAESLAEITRIEDVYADEMTGAAYDFSKNKVVYTVQIGAFLGNVETDTYEDSSGLFNHLYDDGYNRFYSGVFNSNEEALAHLEQMKKDGHKDAFVLGLEGKRRFLPK